jgi:transcriptional regulator GlxA family with amidase domain
VSEPTFEMAKTSTKKVAILALPNTAISSVAAPGDVFGAAGVLTNRVSCTPLAPLFDVSVVSIDGRTVRCVNGFELKPKCSMRELDSPDLVIVSAALGFPGMEKIFPKAVSWLREKYEDGAQLASICTGAFPLAETGLLNGKTATTHWAAADLFRQRYPKVYLRPERMFTDEGDLYCSAGSNAGFDLSLHLVSKLCGRQMALECAKAMVFDLARGGQTPYEVAAFERNHRDTQILEAQCFVEKEFKRDLTIKELAQRVCMSPRTFERRFKTATGQSPVQYLQRIRVEAAKRALESGQEPFDQITYSVGYEDPASFRRLFKRVVGISPRAYRSRFLVSA